MRQFITIDTERRVKIGYLSAGMDACISASGPVYTHRFLVDYRQRPLKLCLNSVCIGLNLEATVGGAVVTDFNYCIVHL
jgi:hypothetical protein